MEMVDFVKIESSDLELIRKWRNSPEVSQYMYTDDQITSEQQLKWFEKISSETNSHYWLIKYGEKKLGVVSIINIDERNSKCNWGFYLGDETIRGKGIGAKVEFKVIEYVFNDLGLNKIMGEVFSFNEKVVKMHEKFGFRREGYLRSHIQKNGVFYDVVTIGLLKEEWMMLREQLKLKIFKVKEQ